jgi:hypothetical protein
VSDFWVPIPADRRSYEVALRVVSDEGRGTVLATDIATPPFR